LALTDYLIFGILNTTEKDVGYARNEYIKERKVCK
jgi:hypothetical protein